MMTLRGIFQIFVMALIFAVGANGVAMASSDVINQEHCVHAVSDADQIAHDHDNHAANHENSNDAVPEHDHETCMIHGCSAVAYDAHGPVEMPVFLSAVLTATEHEFMVLERSETLLRPPNT